MTMVNQLESLHPKRLSQQSKMDQKKSTHQNTNRAKESCLFQNSAVAPLAAKKKTSVESDSDDTRNANASVTNPQEPPAVVESSDDEVEIMEKLEEPEEDDEAELGVYLLSNRIVRC